MNAPTRRAARMRRRLLRFAFATLLLLLAQFLVGMAVNLFVTVPAQHPGAQAGNYFAGVLQVVPWAIVHGAFWLAVHAALGLLLVLVSLGLIAHAVLARHRGWLAASIVGWIGITAAGFNGASFLIFGHGFSSMLMSVGFAVAAGAYITGLALPR